MRRKRKTEPAEGLCFWLAVDVPEDGLAEDVYLSALALYTFRVVGYQVFSPLTGFSETPSYSLPLRRPRSEVPEEGLNSTPKCTLTPTQLDIL